MRKNIHALVANYIHSDHNIINLLCHDCVALALSGKMWFKIFPFVFQIALKCFQIPCIASMTDVKLTIKVLRFSRKSNKVTKVVVLNGTLNYQNIEKGLHFCSEKMSDKETSLSHEFILSFEIFFSLLGRAQRPKIQAQSENCEPDCELV